MKTIIILLVGILLLVSVWFSTSHTFFQKKNTSLPSSISSETSRVLHDTSTDNKNILQNDDILGTWKLVSETVGSERIDYTSGVYSFVGFVREGNSILRRDYSYNTDNPESLRSLKSADFTFDGKNFTLKEYFYTDVDRKEEYGVKKYFEAYDTTFPEKDSLLLKSKDTPYSRYYKRIGNLEYEKNKDFLSYKIKNKKSCLDIFSKDEEIKKFLTLTPFSCTLKIKENEGVLTFNFLENASFNVTENGKIIFNALDNNFDTFFVNSGKFGLFINRNFIKLKDVNQDGFVDIGTLSYANNFVEDYKYYIYNSLSHTYDKK